MKNLLILSLIVTFSLISACSSVPAPNLTNPTKIPGEVSEKEKHMIMEGTRLHDQRLFQEAIDQYGKVLEMNPDNVPALSEIAYSYMEMQNNDAAFEYMFKALEYKSDMLMMSYIMLGTLYDNLGYPDYAVSVYRKGIEYSPHYLLDFNLGVTYMRMQRFNEAEECFFNDLRANPYHSSANFQLSNLYVVTNQKFPAIFAAMKCLAHEPDSDRSGIAVENLLNMLFGGIRKTDEKNTTVYISPDDKNNFLIMNLFLASLIGEGEVQEDIKNKNYVAVLQKALAKIFMAIVIDKDNFISNYYLSFFKELHDKGFDEVFVRYILQSTKQPGIEEWMMNNYADVLKFEEWLKEYEYKTSK